MDTVNAPKPDERFSRAELRYRIADAINDRLKAIPYLHTTAKSTMKWLERRRDRKRIAAAQRDAAAGTVSSVSGAEPEAGTASLDSLPFPPLEMRRLVGPTELDVYDNPTGALVYPWLPAENYQKVFDFGCGCGRVARQLILQRPEPNDLCRDRFTRWHDRMVQAKPASRGAEFQLLSSRRFQCRL